LDSLNFVFNAAFEKIEQPHTSTFDNLFTTQFIKHRCCLIKLHDPPFSQPEQDLSRRNFNRFKSTYSQF
jgi:hypothetical protein